jgi:hypothetical protein
MPRRLSRRSAAFWMPLMSCFTVRASAGLASMKSLPVQEYGLVDVGGSTVDCCTFNLFKSSDGAARCPIFAADVQMLGVERWSACQTGDAHLASEFRQQLNELQWGVIWNTKRHRYQTSERWKSGLPLFFVGGGIKSATHRDSTLGLDAWLRRHNAQGGGVRITALPAPDGLDHGLCAADQVDRLVVAIGLSLPTIEMPEVELPSEIADLVIGAQRSTTESFVGKDQV